MVNKPGIQTDKPKPGRGEVAACSLVCALAMGRIRASAWAWATMTVLLLAWCLFTGVSTVPIDFSASNSHWMWLAGLLSAGGGGLVAIGISSLGSRP